MAIEISLTPRFLDEMFRSTVVEQSERVLLFSTIVELMLLVVCRIKPSIP